MHADPDETFILGQVVSFEGDEAVIRLSNGLFIFADADPAMPKGAFVFVPNHGGEAVLADPSMSWHTSNVAVVRAIYAEGAIVEGNSGLKMVNIATQDKIARGNTVEVHDSDGITRVIDTKPIRYLDRSDDSGDSLDRFRLDAENIKERPEDFGGSDSIVQRAKDLIQVPIDRAEELAKIGAPAVRGVLFTGPPGLGKTLLARILAKLSGATLYQVNGPSIKTKWFGESEQLLHAIFEDAKKQRSIIVFDEIDAVAGRRADATNDANRSIVGQLLTLMDGIESTHATVVIATTNRADDIDDALRRPGRFDWEVEFTYPTRDERLAILKASSRSLRLDAGIPLEALADETTDWTAAELSRIWAEASLVAARDGRESISAEDALVGYERMEARERTKAMVGRRS